MAVPQEPQAYNATTQSTLLRDHPGWLLSPDGQVRRAFYCRGAVWAVICEPRCTRIEPTFEALRLAEDVDVRPVVDCADPARLVVPAYIAEPLRARGPVHRVRNPDLWDALVTAVLRQSNRSVNASRMYQTLCIAYGGTVMTAAGPALLLPRPEVLLTFPDAAFVDLKITSKRRALRAVAEAYCKHGDDWEQLPSKDLLTELQSTPHVAEWTASVAVADITNDFSLCPFADYAISTWGDDFAVATRRRRDETEFARLWRELQGEQLSMFTMLTMAWGLYHGDKGELWRSRWWR